MLGFILQSEASDPTLNSYYDEMAAAGALPKQASGASSFSAFLDQHKTAIIAGAAALLLLAVVKSANN